MSAVALEEIKTLDDPCVETALHVACHFPRHVFATA